MSKRTITCVGGPCDGRTVHLAVDLDLLEYIPDHPRMQFMARTPMQAPDMVGDRHFYRRSLRNPAVFVYQP